MLYSLRTDEISVDIYLGWLGESFVLEGYDIGKTVEKLHGDIDYEYFITVKGPGLQKLFQLNNIEPGLKSELVAAVSEKINGNSSFSMFRRYLKDNDVAFETMHF